MVNITLHISKYRPRSCGNRRVRVERPNVPLIGVCSFKFLSCSLVESPALRCHLAPPTFQAWKFSLIGYNRISFFRKLNDVIIQHLTSSIWAKWCYKTFRDIWPLHPHSTVGTEGQFDTPMQRFFYLSWLPLSKSTLRGVEKWPDSADKQY